MQHVAVSNGTLNVYAQGKGLPLLFVHGFPLNHSMWQPQIDAFTKKNRVIVPDLRGFGESTVTAGTVTMEDMADDLHGILHAAMVDHHENEVLDLLPGPEDGVKSSLENPFDHGAFTRRRHRRRNRMERRRPGRCSRPRLDCSASARPPHRHPRPRSDEWNRWRWSRPMRRRLECRWGLN